MGLLQLADNVLTLQLEIVEAGGNAARKSSFPHGRTRRTVGGGIKLDGRPG